ncbi:MAG: hypothetical protein Crog4KO_23740 [Crocinitomicaceae bacterium]
MPCATCPTSSGAGCEDIQNVKHFFYFKVGSWWVYEEENSGARDSVYVTSASENPSNYDFNVEVYSTHQDYYYRYWPQFGSTVGSTCNESGLACGWCTKVFRSKYKPGDFIGQATCFIFQPEVGLSDYNSNPYVQGNYIYITNLLDSFALNSLNFERTVCLREDNTVMEGYQPTKHFYSENVGLARKELLDSNKVWNLIDYYIVP